MKRIFATGNVVVMVIGIAWMCGCATSPPAATSSEPEPKLDLTLPADPPKTTALDAASVDQDSKDRAQSLVLHAIQTIQAGGDGAAQAELQEAARLDPENKIAQSLLQQANEDPVARLGSRNFLYTVRRGDTLSKIAQRFLGDRYQFYILARYNNIQNPSQLEAGTVIKVPGNAPVSTEAPAPVATTPPLTKESAPPVPKFKAEPEALIEARRLSQSGATSQAIEVLERRLQEAPDDQQAKDLLVSIYLANAKRLRDRGEVDEAVRQLRQVIVVQPGNTEANGQLQEMERNAQAEREFQSGLQAQEQGELEQARANFNETLKLNPNHAQAARKAETVKRDLISRYHKSAMVAFHRQDLEAAIKDWDKVLLLDPDNETARLNRARALDMRERIQKFDQ